MKKKIKIRTEMSLIDAVVGGDYAEIKELLDKGADINQRNTDKYVELMKVSPTER